MSDVKQQDLHQGTGAVVITFAVALMLMIIPLLDWMRPFRPEFTTLVLIYWCMAIPSRVNVGIGWFIGLCEDVLAGTLMGQHALALAVVAFVTVKVHKQVRVYPIWQQALSVFVLVLLSQLLVVWIKGIVGEPPRSWLYWIPSVTSALLWPWTYALLRDVRRKFRVG